MSTPQNRPIRLRGVRHNNLKGINVEFPARQLSVVTGLSGGGKSSLAFETLYAEGQRRYVESLSTYTRQFLEKMPKPDVEAVENIPPSLALEQRNTVMGSRSTVGTQTELVDYLRVLFARVGRTYCVDCGEPVDRIDAETILEQALKWFPGKKAMLLAEYPLSKPSAKLKVDSLLTVFREQGFRRLALRKTKTSWLALDLDDLGTPEFPKLKKTDFKPGSLFVVMDRLKLSKSPDQEDKTRLADSIAQGLAISHGKITFFDMDKKTTKDFDCRYACASCGREHPIPEPQLFSFNSPLGACEKCNGFGNTLDLDEGKVVPDPTKTLKNGAIDPFSKPSFSKWQKDLFRFAERQGISIGKRYSELTTKQKNLLWDGSPKDKSFPGILACFDDLQRYKYKIHVRVFIRRYQSESQCEECHGSRLNQEALAVRVGPKGPVKNTRNLGELLNLSVSDALEWFQKLKLTPEETKVAEEVLSHVNRRLGFLHEIGVGYLSLSRQTKSLSGGEFQRINLATQLGNGLCGTLYVLDEPSIGLHAADTARLIRILERLRDQGNTVVVVEHDLDVIKKADYLVELGPGAGRTGGDLVAQGPTKNLKDSTSLTAQYLFGGRQLRRTHQPRPAARKTLKLVGCRENNLKDLTVEFPLERFVVVTGVSGSGKSTLVHKTLFNAIGKLFHHPQAGAEGEYDRLYGANQIRGVVLLDQKPIGKSSRSNPATYLKAWDEVRKLYAGQVSALRRGYTPQFFSFNVDGGRCPSCKGEGEITLDMHFMAEVKLPCEECGGKRFKKSVLEITYKNKNIYQLLTSTIDEAYELFRSNVTLNRKLSILRDVGLGYLQLGQSAATLSGGEAQRLKVASAIDSGQTDRMLYLFDEPTTGLHMEDVGKLLTVVQDLVSSHNSVIMIEHHLDVIAQADHVIDLGPTGGMQGGHLLGAASPESLMRTQKSVTGKSLSEYLGQ